MATSSKANSFEEDNEPFYEVTRRNAKKHSPPKNTEKNKTKEDSFRSAVSSFMGLPTGRFDNRKETTAPKRPNASPTTSAAATAKTTNTPNLKENGNKTTSPTKKQTKNKEATQKTTTKDQFEDWMATTSKEEQEEIMLQIVRTNQQKKRETNKHQQQSDPSDPSESSSSSSDSDDEKRSRKQKKHYSKKKSDRQPSYRRQAFAAERLRSARPQKESDKYDGTINMNYRKFKNRFMTFSDNKDINPLDVLNELPHWVTGSAKRLVEAFISLEDPKDAIRTIWMEMDKCFSQSRKTVSEMMTDLSKKEQVKSGDVDGMMDLQTELQAIRSEAIAMGQWTELNDAHNVRKIVVERLPYFMAKKFYDDQAEMKVKLRNQAYEKNFQDAQDMIGKEIQSLRSIGKTFVPKTAKQETKAICAHSVEQPQQQKRTVAGIVSQSPSAGKSRELTGCEFCQAGHAIQNCNKLKEMSREMRAEALKKGFFCFKCLRKGHRSVNCKQPHAQCDDCEGHHQTLLHGLTKFLATKKTTTEASKEQGAEGTSRPEQQTEENKEA